MIKSIKTSKNGTKYIFTLDFKNLLESGKLQYYFNKKDGWHFLVCGDRYYSLFDKGTYYQVYDNQVFINLTQFQKLEQEHTSTLNDFKQNKTFYSSEELAELRGKMHYIAELINRGRNQLTNLKILK